MTSVGNTAHRICAERQIQSKRRLVVSCQGLTALSVGLRAVIDIERASR